MVFDRKAYARQYEIDHREQRRETHKKSYYKHHEKRLLNQRNYLKRPDVKKRYSITKRAYNSRPEIRQHQKENKRRYYLENRDEFLEYRRNHATLPSVKKRIKAYNKVYWKKTHFVQTAYHKQWKVKNPLLKKAGDKRYYLKNKQKIMKYQHKWVRAKAKADVIFRISLTMKARLRSLINTNNHSFWKLVGYNSIELRQHLEKQFDSKMSWENYGVHGWHIDHKVPTSMAKTKEEIIILFALDNLQPLWAKDNIKKSNKVIADLFNLDLNYLSKEIKVGVEC